MLIKDIEKMEAYTPTEYVNDSEPDLDADNLNKTERQLRDTVAKANEIIDTLKSLISNVSVNSEDTVPSSAVAYKMEQDIEQLNSNINNLASVQNSKVDKTQLSGNGTMINTICLYKNEGDGKLYLQVNWNDGIAYIQADQTSGL